MPEIDTNTPRVQEKDWLSLQARIARASKSLSRTFDSVGVEEANKQLDSAIDSVRIVRQNVSDANQKLLNITAIAKRIGGLQGDCLAQHINSGFAPNDGEAQQADLSQIGELVNRVEAFKKLGTVDLGQLIAGVGASIRELNTIVDDSGVLTQRTLEDLADTAVDAAAKLSENIQDEIDEPFDDAETAMDAVGTEFIEGPVEDVMDFLDDVDEKLDDITGKGLDTLGDILDKVTTIQNAIDIVKAIP